MEPTKFTHLPLSPDLQQVIRELGFENLTPIQALTLPLLMEGKDVIGQSKTGSGKTVAFSLPILEKLKTENRVIQALVLLPTRELCLQVAREIRKLGRNKKNLHVLTLTGGHPAYLDMKSLEHGAHVVVGTPGRILDHLKRKTLDLQHLNTVVLDEADRMLDMGFRESIEKVLSQTPPLRQTSLFSATYPSTIEALGKKYLKEAQRLTILETDASAVPIEEHFYFAESDQKLSFLNAFFRVHELNSTLVFCNQKFQVDEVCEALRKEGFSASKLHGDLEQKDRERVMAKFRNQSTRILVATDVAARGIDIANLDAVVNYDMPIDPESYIHRIGRTGRAGATGLAATFLMRKELPKVERLNAYRKSNVQVEEGSSLTGRARPKKNPSSAAMITLSISGGRKDKLRPGDILGALTGDVGLPGDQIGKIEILDHSSFVAIDKRGFSQALSKLKSGKIKGRRFVVQEVR